MTRPLAVVLVLVLVLAALATPARADEVPTRVQVGFQLIALRQVDVKEQSFHADFYMWIRYPFTADEARAAEIEKFEFMNGEPQGRDLILRKHVGDEIYVCWRNTGTFFFHAELRNYPFDVQTFAIEIEHPTLEVNQLLFEEDRASYTRSSAPAGRWGVKDSVSLPEFELRGSAHEVNTSRYDTDFGDPSTPNATSTYSRIVFSVRFARDFMPYFFKIIVPLIVIVAMAYLVFWLPPKEIQTASGLAITALLSCIAFNVAVSQNLPEVGYLIVSDKFFITTYVLLFLTLAQSVLTYVWHDRGLEPLAQRWDLGCRILFPLLYIGSFVYLFVQAMARRG